MHSVESRFVMGLSNILLARERISTRTHSVESRFVIGLSNVLFAGVYVYTFQPGNFTGWGSEGITTFVQLPLGLIVFSLKLCGDVDVAGGFGDLNLELLLFGSVV